MGSKECRLMKGANIFFVFVLISNGKIWFKKGSKVYFVKGCLVASG